MHGIVLHSTVLLRSLLYCIANLLLGVPFEPPYYHDDVIVFEKFHFQNVLRPR